MRAVIVGAPGAGKTSVARGLGRFGWKLVTFGTVMFEIAKERGVKHRDEMRTLIRGEDYKRLQEEAADKIASMEGNVLVDTHCSILKPEGYYPGLPIGVLKKLGPDAIVVVEASREDIEKRREKDRGERTREGDPVEHQKINRYFAVAYSAISGAPVSFVTNEQGKLEETVERVAGILKAVRSNG